MEYQNYHLERLEEIAQGDSDFVKEMVGTFIENVTFDVETIQSLRLTEDWTAIAEKAHKLASNFAYLGAENLRNLAANIENTVLNENNLFGVAGKTELLCNESTDLIVQLKKDFDF